MPQSSLYYTDLELPTLNADGSTYGQILNDYVQGLETKLKDLSDRINAAGVGSTSTLAQIDRDIAQTTTNTSSILPDPYSGDYTTVSTWPAFDTELTALGLSPPETASEIETFFSSGDFTSFAIFLNDKVDALDIIVTQAESDLSSALYDTCATSTILSARTAAISAGTSEINTLVYTFGGGLDCTVATAVVSGKWETTYEMALNGSKNLVQTLLDEGVLVTDSFESFYGSSTDDSVYTSNLSIGGIAYALSPSTGGEIRSTSTADVQIKYTGPGTVDSTSRLVVRLPPTANTTLPTGGAVAGQRYVLNYRKKQKRYPYPTLNCSNPSPPYFS
jgi:hypothetical protein